MLRNLGWLLAGKGVGAVLSLVYLALAARRLGPEQFGQFTLVLGAAQAIAALVGFQSWQIVVRFGAAHLGLPVRHAGLARLIGFCVSIDLAAAIVGCLLAWLGVTLLAPRLGWSPDLVRMALLFSAATLLSVRSTAVGVLRLLDRFRIGALADATTPIMRFLGALVAVAVGPTLHGFLSAWAVAEIATAAAYWIAARRIGGSLVRLPRLSDLRQAPTEQPGLWRFTWTTNLALSLETGTRQIAVLLVGLVSGPVMAGNYRLAAQLSQSIVRVSDMAARAIFAEAARSGMANGGTASGGIASGAVTGGALVGGTPGLVPGGSTSVVSGGMANSVVASGQIASGAVTGGALVGAAPDGMPDGATGRVTGGTANSVAASGGIASEAVRGGTLVGAAPGGVPNGASGRVTGGMANSVVASGHIASGAVTGGALFGAAPDGVPDGVPDGATSGATGGVAPGGTDPRVLLRHVTRLALAAAAGLALVLLLGRYGLLLLGGRAHLDAYPLLRLLAIAAAIDLAGVAFEPVLMAMGQATRTLLLRAVTALVLLAALSVLLPRFGAIGAANATVIASIAGFILFGQAARRCVHRAAGVSGASPIRELVP